MCVNTEQAHASCRPGAIAEVGVAHHWQCSEWAVLQGALKADLDRALVMQGKQNRAQFSNWLCYEASGLCKSKPPPLPKGRKPGPAFQVIDPKEAEMEKMLAGMKVAHKTRICICLYTHAVDQLPMGISVERKLTSASMLHATNR